MRPFIVLSLCCLLAACKKDKDPVTTTTTTTTQDKYTNIKILMNWSSSYYINAGDTQSVYLAYVTFNVSDSASSFLIAVDAGDVSYGGTKLGKSTNLSTAQSTYMWASSTTPLPATATLSASGNKYFDPITYDDTLKPSLLVIFPDTLSKSAPYYFSAPGAYSVGILLDSAGMDNQDDIAQQTTNTNELAFTMDEDEKNQLGDSVCVTISAIRDISVSLGSNYAYIRKECKWRKWVKVVE